MTTPIRSMPELIAALCARRDELNISHETIDNIAGLQSGYTSKLLAPNPIKNLGPMSFEALLGALGVAVVVVPDPVSAALVEDRWQKRKRPQKLPPSIPPSIENEVPLKLPVTSRLQALLKDPHYMRKIGLRGADVRNYRLSARRRKQIARDAAKARWQRRDEQAAS